MPFRIKIYVDPWTWPDTKFRQREKLYEAILRLEETDFESTLHLFELKNKIWPLPEVRFTWVELPKLPENIA